MTLYKWTDAEGKTWGDFQWPLPHDGKPGDWVPALEGEIIPCERGYHVCKTQDLIWWINARLFEVQCQGDQVRQEGHESKNVFRGPCRLVREIECWNERTARLFACDCAERILPIYEKARPGDGRVRDCIATVRRYADGTATERELAAAGAAAGVATEAVAGAAAGAAAGVATEAAAGAAAWAAAGAAARAAAGAAAGAAERKWQAERLISMLGLEEDSDGSR